MLRDNPPYVPYTAKKFLDRIRLEFGLNLTHRQIQLPATANMGERIGLPQRLRVTVLGADGEMRRKKMFNAKEAREALRTCIKHSWLIWLILIMLVIITIGVNYWLPL